MWPFLVILTISHEQNFVGLIFVGQATHKKFVSHENFSFYRDPNPKYQTSQATYHDISHAIISLH